MDPELLAVLLVAPASAVTGYLLVRRRPRLLAAVALLGFAPLVAVLAPMLGPAWLAVLYPSGTAGETVAAAGFLATGALAAGYRDSGFRITLQLMLAPAMAYLLLGGPLYAAARGDYLRSLDHRVVEGITLQTDYFGCAPSSLATVLRSYGLQYTEGQLAYALRTTPLFGTVLLRVPGVVNRVGAERGLAARVVDTDLEALRALALPAILAVRVGDIRHAVALLGFDGEDVLIGDPLHGRQRIPAREFQARSRWNGRAIIVAPTAAL